MKLTITRIGNELGIVLPQDLLERLQLKSGDTVYAKETADGVTISTRNRELDETLKIGRQLMNEERELLRKLAE